jgi:solute carrier family 34 (sodium-dependent phosphate cotransporter)
LTEAIVKDLEYVEGAPEIKMLKVITEPVTKAILLLDSDVLSGWAMNNASYENSTLLKIWCGEEKCKRSISQSIE